MGRLSDIKKFEKNASQCQKTVKPNVLSCLVTKKNIQDYGTQRLFSRLLSSKMERPRERGMQKSLQNGISRKT